MLILSTKDVGKNVYIDKQMVENDIHCDCSIAHHYI